MEKEYRRRSSILKPQKLRNPLGDIEVEQLEANKEQTLSAIPSTRRISFASSNFVKEFVADPEKNTIWDTTYEQIITLDSTPSESGSNGLLPSNHSLANSEIDKENNYSTKKSSTCLIKTSDENMALTYHVYQKTTNIIIPTIEFTEANDYEGVTLNQTLGFKQRTTNGISPKSLNKTFAETEIMEMTCSHSMENNRTSKAVNSNKPLGSNPTMEFTCCLSKSSLETKSQEQDNEISMELTQVVSPNKTSKNEPVMDFTCRLSQNSNSIMDFTCLSQKTIGKDFSGKHDPSMDFTCVSQKAAIDELSPKSTSQIEPTMDFTCCLSQKTINNNVSPKTASRNDPSMDFISLSQKTTVDDISPKKTSTAEPIVDFTCVLSHKTINNEISLKTISKNDLSMDFTCLSQKGIVDEISPKKTFQVEPTKGFTRGLSEEIINDGSSKNACKTDLSMGLNQNTITNDVSPKTTFQTEPSSNYTYSVPPKTIAIEASAKNTHTNDLSMGQKTIANDISPGKSFETDPTQDSTQKTFQSVQKSQMEDNVNMECSQSIDDEVSPKKYSTALSFKQRSSINPRCNVEKSLNISDYRMDFSDIVIDDVSPGKNYKSISYSTQNAPPDTVKADSFKMTNQIVKTPTTSFRISIAADSPGIDDTQHFINYNLANPVPKSDFSKIITGDLNPSFINSKLMPLSAFNSDAFPCSFESTRQLPNHDSIDVGNDPKSKSLQTTYTVDRSVTANDVPLESLKRKSNEFRDGPSEIKKPTLHTPIKRDRFLSIGNETMNISAENVTLIEDSFADREQEFNTNDRYLQRVRTCQRQVYESCAKSTAVRKNRLMEKTINWKELANSIKETVKNLEPLVEEEKLEKNELPSADYDSINEGLYALIYKFKASWENKKTAQITPEPKKEVREKRITLKESIEEKFRGFKRNAMHLCKLKEDLCEFHVLNKSQKIVICFDEQDGNVNKMDVIDETAGKPAELKLFLNKVLIDNLKKDKISAAVGEKHDVLTLLDYIELTVENLLNFENESIALSIFGLTMENNFIATFKMHSTYVPFVWRISVNMCDADNIKEESLTVCAEIGEVNEKEIKALGRTCPTGLKFLKSFIRAVYEYQKKIELKFK